MKISQLASKPQLVKLVLDSEEIVSRHGESIEFWTWDRQPLDVFMKLANANVTDQGSVIGIVKSLILDEEGREVIADGNTIPTDILIAAIDRIVRLLGK